VQAPFQLPVPSEESQQVDRIDRNRLDRRKPLMDIARKPDLDGTPNSDEIDVFSSLRSRSAVSSDFM
jgi:hypothetical protein